jgi:DNA gyrase subunit A
VALGLAPLLAADAIEADDIVVVASGGTTIRTPVKEISSQGRSATGVRIMSMDDGQVVASAALVLSHDEA